MRKTILIGTIIVIATWFSSCGINPSASLIIEEYNDSTAIIPSPNNLPVPEGMALGIIKSRIGNNKLERNQIGRAHV